MTGPDRPSAEAALPPDKSGVERGLEVVRDELHAGAEWLARRVDGWFGDKPFDQGGWVAGRVSLRTLWRQTEGMDWTTRFAIRLNPPNIREKGYFFIGRDNERDVVTDRPDTFTAREQLQPETRENQALFVGAGAQLTEGLGLRLGVRGGYKPYAQARYQKTWLPTVHDRFDFSETLFWTLDDRFGSTTSLAYGHAFSPSLAVRWQGAATWTQDTSYFALSSSVGLFRSFGEGRLLSLETLTDGQTGADAAVNQYGVRAKWEQPIYGNWLLGELNLGYFRPLNADTQERSRQWAVGAAVQLNF